MLIAQEPEYVLTENASHLDALKQPAPLERFVRKVHAPTTHAQPNNVPPEKYAGPAMVLVSRTVRLVHKTRFARMEPVRLTLAKECSVRAKSDAKQANVSLTHARKRE